jgi:four helix bundle protein
MKKNILKEKTFQFSLEIFKTAKYLMDVKKEFIISRQLLRSGTSIGANVEESQEVLTKKEFIYKLTIALREAKETHYWLRLLNALEKESTTYTSLLQSCDEIIKILNSIIITTKQRYLS